MQKKIEEFFKWSLSKLSSNNYKVNKGCIFRDDSNFKIKSYIRDFGVDKAIEMISKETLKEKAMQIIINEKIYKKNNDDIEKEILFKNIINFVGLNKILYIREIREFQDKFYELLFDFKNY